MQGNLASCFDGTSKCNGYLREQHFIKMSENLTLFFFMDTNNLIQIALQYKYRISKMGQKV